MNQSNRGKGGRTGARGTPKQTGPGSRGPKRGQGARGTRPVTGDPAEPRARKRRSGGKPSSRSQPPSNRRSGARKGLGGDQVEGRQAVRELLLAQKRPVNEILMIEDLDDADILTDIRELAADLQIPLKSVTRKRFDADALTMSHQGVLAKAKPLQERSLSNLLSVKNPFLLVLDGITDPQNLGAILRTAECAGVTGVLLPRHRAVHVSPTVTKTAAGAIEHLPMGLVGGVPATLTELSKAGVLTVGLEADAPTRLFDVNLSGRRPVALVLGAEGKGLSQLVRKRVDVLASLPLLGQLNSLNVAMATSAACFEVVRQRSQHEPPTSVAPD